MKCRETDACLCAECMVRKYGPMYRLSDDVLVNTFTDVDATLALRDEARAEFDARSDRREGR